MVMGVLAENKHVQCLGLSIHNQLGFVFCSCSSVVGDRERESFVNCDSEKRANSFFLINFFLY